MVKLPSEGIIKAREKFYIKLNLSVINNREKLETNWMSSKGGKCLNKLYNVYTDIIWNFNRLLMNN